MEIKRFEAAGLKCIEVSPERATGQDLPMVVMLHGRGDWGESYVDIAPALDDQKYRYIFPTAPLPLPGALFEWFRFDTANLGAGLAGARTTITKLLNELTARYATPADRTVLSGFSQGGMMTLDVGLRYGQKLAGLMALSGALLADAPLDLGRLQNTKAYYAQDAAIGPMLAEAARLGQGPILIAHGTYDMVVPVLAGRGSRDILKESGLSVEYYEFSGGHELTRDELTHISQFLNKIFP